MGYILEARNAGLPKKRLPRQLNYDFFPSKMFSEPIPMTSEHMHVLVDRNDVSNVSPRVIREAEFLLLDSFDVGMQAWEFLKTQEKDLWNFSK